MCPRTFLTNLVNAERFILLACVISKRTYSVVSNDKTYLLSGQSEDCSKSSFVNYALRYFFQRLTRPRDIQ